MSSEKSKPLTKAEIQMLAFLYETFVPDIMKLAGELTKDGIPDINKAQEKIAAWENSNELLKS